MVPDLVSPRQAGGRAATGHVTVVPPAATVDALTIPAARSVPTGAYFMLFKLCGCGHSSAWHSGAFGDAWRAGVQVQGPCEAADESARPICRCGSFRPDGRSS